MLEERHKSNILRIPDADSREYLEQWGGLIREFARRYDDHPLLETIDVTYIGPWGEGAGKCSPEQCARFAALWQEPSENAAPGHAERRTNESRARDRLGAARRLFGDLKAPGSHDVQRQLSCNHMYESYPAGVWVCGATDVWKTAPVHFETCGVPMHWYNGGYNAFEGKPAWDIDFILEQGLKYHTTYFMPKYAALPENGWISSPRFAAK